MSLTTSQPASGSRVIALNCQLSALSGLYSPIIEGAVLESDE